jgi:hypothetical protein
MITRGKAEQYLREETPAHVRHGAYDLKGATITGIAYGGMSSATCRVSLGATKLAGVPLSHIYPMPVKVA